MNSAQYVNIQTAQWLCLYERNGLGSGISEFDGLFRDQYSGLVQEIYLMLGNWQAAEDAVQEAFLRLLRHWRKVSRYDRPGAWVRRVAIRVARRAARRSALVRKAEDWLSPASNPTPATDPDLLEAVLALPFAQRAALVLRTIEGLSYAEVARILGCSEATGRVHFHRARRRLSNVLGTEVPDAE